MIKIANYSNIIVFTLWNYQSELNDSLKIKMK